MVKAQTTIGTLVLTGVWLSTVTMMTEGQGGPAGDSSIIDPTAELELLFDVGSETEGPSVAFDGTVFFVSFDFSELDAGGTIWRFDPEAGEASVFRSRWGLTAGTAIDANGDLLVGELGFGGGRCISRIALDTGDTTVVADTYRGHPLNGVNDLVVDEKGRVYFTEYDVIASNEVLHHGGNGVYRIDQDGSVNRIISDAGLPNGIVLSPDQRSLYVTTNQFDILGTNAVLSYDLSPDGDVVRY
jgi:gluconolactonase